MTNKELGVIVSVAERAAMVSIDGYFYRMDYCGNPDEGETHFSVTDEETGEQLDVEYIDVEFSSHKFYELVEIDSTAKV